MLTRLCCRVTIRLNFTCFPLLEDGAFPDTLIHCC
uniref:Uncharacterized protein n=1 Tax=Anguilla anguilla TaxID=7936 RepID=A0A0E9W706_ANGAN